MHVKGIDLAGLSLLLLLGQSICWSANTEPGSLLKRVTLIRLDVAGGRIICPSLSNAASRSFSTEEGGSQEVLTINPTSDEPSLNYRWQSAERRFVLELHGDGSLDLCDTQAAESIVVEQRSHAPLKVCIERPGLPKQELRAKSLWHLLVLHPEVRSCLLPRLSLLAPNWHLGSQVREIEELLAEEIDPSWRQRRAEWDACIKKMQAADFKSRQAADKQLRAGGPVVAAYLQSLDRAAMEPEQQRRIARILESLGRQVDTPATVAAAWCYDTQVWSARLQHEDAQIRQRASDHLADLLDRPLSYDPQADGKTRLRQARVLEETLLRR